MIVGIFSFLGQFLGICTERVSVMKMCRVEMSCIQLPLSPTAACAGSSKINQQGAGLQGEKQLSFVDQESKSVEICFFSFPE